MRRRAMAFAAALVAASAWFGAAGLAFGLLEFPDRLARRLPFGSLVFGGVALAVVVALPYSALAAVAWRGDRRLSLASFASGLLLIGWLAVEVVVVREFSFLQPTMGSVGVAFVLMSRRWRHEARRRRPATRVRLTAVVRERPLPAFFVLAIALSWSYWVPDAIAGGHWTHFPGLLGPAVAALITSVVGGGDEVGRLWRAVAHVRVAARLYAAALVPLASAAVVLVVRWAAGTDLEGRLSRMAGLPDIGWFGVATVALLINGFGEEIGWRGFAWARLREKHSLRTAAFWVAVPWTLWHLPLFWIDSGMRGFPLVALPGFLLSLACGAVVLGWLYDRSASVAVVALWHTMLNMATATDATKAAAPFVSIMVISLALWLVHRDVRSEGRPKDRAENPLERPTLLSGHRPVQAPARNGLPVPVAHNARRLSR